MADADEALELVEQEATPGETGEGEQQAAAEEGGEGREEEEEEEEEGASTDTGSTAELEVDIADKVMEMLDSKWDEVSQEALELLQKLIQTDTQNFREDGTEMAAVLVLKEKFDEAGIPYEIVEPKSGRGNIVARLAGDGSSRKGAILLSSHLDTVRAPKDDWKDSGWRHNPFSGEIDADDECMYGRGAVDMKNMAAMSVTLLCFISKNGIKLSRDLIFAGLADEERSDSTYGVKYLIQNRPELIEADVVFNELGGFSMFIEGKEIFPIQVGEKGIAQLKITATGSGGHASIYHTDNPIAKVGEVAHQLDSTKLPVRPVMANRVSIENLANFLPFPKSTIFRRLLSPRFSDIILERLLTADQQSSLGPLLRNTANPTVISGGSGDQYNQVPTSAHVIIDARILPECTIDDVIYDVQQVLGPADFKPRRGANNEELPPELTIEVMASHGPHFQNPEEDGCPEVLEVIQSVIAKRANGASIAPTMIPGATDSYWYAQNPRKRPVCLGFAPMRFPEDLRFVKLFHGTNERIPVAGFKWGTRVLADVVCELCGAKLEE